jgi:hypothetical protein
MCRQAISGMAGGQPGTTADLQRIAARQWEEMMERRHGVRRQGRGEEQRTAEEHGESSAIAASVTYVFRLYLCQKVCIDVVSFISAVESLAIRNLN